jgi:ankyrin repeat protein
MFAPGAYAGRCLVADLSSQYERGSKMNNLLSWLNNWSPSSIPSLAEEGIEDGGRHIVDIEEMTRILDNRDIAELSRVLDAGRFDLTQVDWRTGNTLLHQALLSSTHEMTELLITRVSQQSPEALSVQNRDGQTPLMLASAMGRIGLMQTLIQRGGQVGDCIPLQEIVPNAIYTKMGHAQIQARLLSEAKGDLNQALSLAYTFQHGASAQFFLNAGASPQSVLIQGREGVDWLHRIGVCKADTLPMLIEAARASEDSRVALNYLLSAPFVMSVLDEALYDSVGLTDDQSRERTQERLTSLVKAGVNGNELLAFVYQRHVSEGFPDRHGTLSTQVSEKLYATSFDNDAQEEEALRQARGHGADYFIIRDLIALGVPAIDELVQQSIYEREHKAGSLSKDMIAAGADYRAIFTLNKDGYTEARAGIISHVIAQVLLSEMSTEEKVADLKMLIKAGFEFSVQHRAYSFIVDRLISERHYASNAQLLVAMECLEQAGVTPGWGTISQLGYQLQNDYSDQKTVNAVMTKAAEQGAMALSLLLRVIRVDTVYLCTKIKELEASAYSAWGRGNMYGSAGHTINSLKFLAEVGLRDVLTRSDMAIQDKAVALSQWSGSPIMDEIAGGLLNHAVQAKHLATVKLLVSSGIDATEAFVNVARDLSDAQSMHKEPRIALLIKHGADYQPAVIALRHSINNYLGQGKFESAKAEQEALSRLEATIQQVIGVSIASQGGFG